MENGKAALALRLKNGLGCGTTELHVLRPRNGIEAKYLYYFIHRESFRKEAAQEFTGTAGQLRVPVSFIREAEIPLPSVNEQRSIVAKLEKLLARVETCQERLDKIPALLKRFLQSVLAAACSGLLTIGWREENCVNDEWHVRTLGELFTMRNGKSLTAVKRKNGAVPVYGGNGYMGTHNAANTEGQIIVIGRVGAQCGNVHYIIGKVWVTDNAISLQAKKEVVPAFYAFFLRSQNLNKLSGGTGQPYVSQEILSPLEIPAVSLAEQHEIVRRVEALFKIADQIEARYQKAKAHVEKLTQAILAKAFHGELVPQDPNDEPASELLKSIQEKKYL
jgi:type I restriction enzyme S subunit